MRALGLRFTFLVVEGVLERFGRGRQIGGDGEEYGVKISSISSLSLGTFVGLDVFGTAVFAIRGFLVV